MRKLLPAIDLNIHPALLHLAAWIAYAGYIFITNYVARPTLQFSNTVISLIPYCLTFYVVLYYLKHFGQHKLSLVILGIVLLFISMASVAYLFLFRLLPVFGLRLYDTTDFRFFLQASVLGYVQFLVYALLYYYSDKTIKKERELVRTQAEISRVERQKIEQELENARLKTQEIIVQKEKVEYEYAYLQSQINPHFLFNTLNVLFSQAMKFSPALADNISKLGEIMRYSIQAVEDKVTAVPVQKELDNLQTLIEIIQLRFDDSFAINYSIEGEVSGQLVPPLSMISVVENAFKYGELKDPENPLSIRVLLAPGLLSFVCRNKKRPLTTIPASHNIGLRNLNDRLQSAFKNRYKISITDENGFYSFQLIIQSV